MTADVTIVGAGIGGLACAIALAGDGARVEVLERASRIAEVGAGVQISPNGYAVLHALGLGEEMRALGIASRAVALRNGSNGRHVARMPLDGRNYYFVRRAALIGLLERAARTVGVDIRLGACVESVEDGKHASFIVHGKRRHAAFLVGADGINSKVRPGLVGAEAARFTGQVAWRALIDADAPDEAQVFLGPGRHVVVYPIGKRLVNLVAVEERGQWHAEGWHHPGDPTELRRKFGIFLGPVSEWLDRVETCHVWGLFRHPPADRWCGASLALIGDAAHPTLPFLAQGANLALEDAWCLACALSDHDRRGALMRYQTTRLPRVTRAIDAAEANAKNYHLSGSRKLAAHAALRLADRVPGMLLRRFDWLYEHDVTRDWKMPSPRARR